MGAAMIRKASAKPPKRKMDKEKKYNLNFRSVDFINSSLSDDIDVSGALPLPCNKDPQKAFQGMTPGYDGFVLKPSECAKLIHNDGKAKEIIRPYLIGRELNSGDGRPKRYIIDCEGLTVLDLAKYPKVYEHLLNKVHTAVEHKVKEVEKSNADQVGARKEHLDRWWTFWARRLELRRWTREHSRILAASRTQRWPFIYEFISTAILPGDKLQLFAFDDDYSFGILQSNVHCLWYKTKGTRLKNEVDYNYSSESIFDTFPWPQEPTIADVKKVCEAAKALRELRTTAISGNKDGLRGVYNTLSVSGSNPLADAHMALDHIVSKAYGFSSKKDLLKQLLDLNVNLSKGGQMQVPPGIPRSAKGMTSLVSKDCITPTKFPTL